MKLDPKLTQKIAELAALKLSEKEIAAFTAQLTRVLEYVESLQKVDLRGQDGKEVEPLIHPVRALAQPLREDQARPRDCGSQEPIEGYQVPPVL